MSQNYARPLHNPQLVENFLTNALSIDPGLYNNITSSIVDGELGVANILNRSQTLTSNDYRDPNYRDDVKRWGLRKTIIDELTSEKRLDDDDEIELGKGGALPKSSLQSNKQAFIIIGLPASGKSGVASNLADDNGAVIVDSDYAKRKLPEFNRHKYGASVVHEESSQMTYGFSIDNPDLVMSLYEFCLDKGFNIVIPKIGNSTKSIINLAETLKEKNSYEVHLILIALLKRQATVRAVKRFSKTGRYVPLGLIFDGYGNDPCLTYFLLRCKRTTLFSSFGAISTDVVEGANPLCIDWEGNSPAKKFEYKDRML